MTNTQNNQLMRREGLFTLMISEVPVPAHLVTVLWSCTVCHGGDMRQRTMFTHGGQQGKERDGVQPGSPNHSPPEACLL